MVDEEYSVEGYLAYAKNPLAESDEEVERDASPNEGAIRSQALLSKLRTSKKFTDSVIVVSDHKFPIHRAIVSPLSPFFFRMFSSGAKDMRCQTIHVLETSPKAMSTLLDFAYGANVALEDDGRHALEVWKLAHRLQVHALGNIVGEAAVKCATIDNSIHIFHEAKRYKCIKEIETIFAFIAHSFKHVSESTEFETLTMNEIEDFLQSKELIASELEKYNGLKAWITAPYTMGRRPHTATLLSCVRFELLSRSDMRTVLADFDFLPVDGLSMVFQRIVGNGLTIPGMSVRFQASKAPGSQFALTIGRLSEALENPMPPFFFKCHHWVMSARVQFWLDGIYLAFEFENRFKAEDRSKSLAEDVSSYTFDVSAILVSEKGHEESIRKSGNCATAANKLRLKIAQLTTRFPDNRDELKEKYGDWVRGAMSLLVNLQCIETK